MKNLVVNAINANKKTNNLTKIKKTNQCLILIINRKT